MRASLVPSLSVVLALVAGCYQSRVTAANDTGVRSDGGAAIDAGLPVLCSEESLPPFGGPPCSDAVNACRRGCPSGDEPCRDACFDAPCRACVYGTIFHCANEAGCEPVWQSFACCVEGVPGCGELRGFDRVMCATSCPMRFEPYARCIEEMGGEACFLRAAMDCGLR